MTTITEIPNDKRIQSIIEAALLNDWKFDTKADTHSFTFTAENPAAEKGHYGKVVANFWLDGEKWKVDGAKVYSRSFGGNEMVNWSFEGQSMAMRDVVGFLGGGDSPRVQAAKALDEMAREARREALAQAYAEEPDSSTRKRLRKELEAGAKGTSARDEWKKRVNGGHPQDAFRYADDAIAEEEFSNLCARALSWEGNTDQKGTEVTTLEEAVTRVADSCVQAVLREARGQASRSTSTMSNMAQTCEVAGKSKFVERFHPIYADFGGAWGYEGKDEVQGTVVKWLGGNW